MAHYPAYGIPREGQVPGQPASVVMGGLDTISASSEVGQQQPLLQNERSRGVGNADRSLGLSVWVQRLRGVSVAPNSPLEHRGRGENTGPRLPPGIDRLPPGVPLFGALRGLASSKREEQLPGGERPGDAESAHEGGEVPTPSSRSPPLLPQSPSQDEKLDAANPPRKVEASALRDTPNEARGSGPSGANHVFLGGVRHSTDTASRSVEGPSEHAGPAAGGNNLPPPQNQPSSGQPRSNQSAQALLQARRYGLADAIREQQEAAAVRKLMSQSGSGSHPFKASNGTNASGGGHRTGSRPSGGEVGLPSPSVGHPPQKPFSEASQNEAVRSGGSKMSSQDVKGPWQARNGAYALGGSQSNGLLRVKEELTNLSRERGFGSSFGSLKDLGEKAQNDPRESLEGFTQSLEGSGGGKKQSGGMCSWVERLGVGQNVTKGGGRDQDRGRNEASEKAKDESQAALRGSSQAGEERRSGLRQGGQVPTPGDGQKGTVVDRKLLGGLSFLPSFKMPPPLVIPNATSPPQGDLQVQDVAEAGGQAIAEPPARPKTAALSPWAARLGLGGFQPRPNDAPPPVTSLASPVRAPPKREALEGGPLESFRPKQEPQRRSSFVNDSVEISERFRGGLQGPPVDLFPLGGAQKPGASQEPTPPNFGRGFRGGYGDAEQWSPSGSDRFEGFDRSAFHMGWDSSRQHKPPSQSRNFALPRGGSKNDFRVPKSPTARQGPFKLPANHSPEPCDPFAWPPRVDHNPKPSDPNPNSERSRMNPFVAALQGNPSLAGPRFRAPDHISNRPPTHPKPFESFGKWGAPAMQFPFPPGQGFFGRKSPDSSKGGSSTSPQEAARGLQNASQNSGGFRPEPFLKRGPARSGGSRGVDSERGNMYPPGGFKFESFRPHEFKEPKPPASPQVRSPPSGDGSWSGGANVSPNVAGRHEVSPKPSRSAVPVGLQADVFGSKAYAYPSFLERPSHPEASGSAATKSVPLELLKPERSDGGKAESECEGGVARVPDCGGASGPSSGSLNVGGQSSLGAPSPSNPSLNVSNDSLLNNLFDADSPHGHRLESPHTAPSRFSPRFNAHQDSEQLVRGENDLVQETAADGTEMKQPIDSPDAVVPSGRTRSPRFFTPDLEQHDRSASLAELPGVNRLRPLSQAAPSGATSAADTDGDRMVPLSKLCTGRNSPTGEREVMSDGLPPKRVFDRLNVREKGESPRAASVSAAVDAARESLAPLENGRGEVDVNLDRMAAELAEAVAAYGRFTVEAAVRRHMRVVKIRKRSGLADDSHTMELPGSERTDWTEQSEEGGSKRGRNAPPRGEEEGLRRVETEQRERKVGEKRPREQGQQLGRFHEEGGPKTGEQDPPAWRDCKERSVESSYEEVAKRRKSDDDDSVAFGPDQAAGPGPHIEDVHHSLKGRAEGVGTGKVWKEKRRSVGLFVSEDLANISGLGKDGQISKESSPRARSAPARLKPQASTSSASAGLCRSESGEPPFVNPEVTATISH